jgi:acetylornithine deacetylase/succinyl-diaminopimelate desuccinylase-like protein
LSDILKVKTITMSYFTEMYFWNKKSKAVVLGPGDYSVAHTEREKVSKRELLTVEEKYLKILTDDRVRRDMND